MAEILDKASEKTGLPPGSLIHIGEHAISASSVSAFVYDFEQCTHHQDITVEESADLILPGQVSWINIIGVHDTELIAEVGALFGLHHLLLEDLMHTGQRPKIEEYEQTLFVVLKMLTYNESRNAVQEEQISLILGNDWVLSFQEREGDVFDPVRHRIANTKGKIRKMGNDYLAYALVDTVVDHYFGVLEHIGDKIEDLQDSILERPNPEVLQTLHEAKQELIFVRHSIWPLRDSLREVVRGEFAQVSEQVEVYFRDVLDHIHQVLDALESYRDVLSGTLDIYISLLSRQMNQVMKVLTVIATLFIPLTFVVGIYGMNFEYMPELSWRYGYPAVWGGMIGLAGGMLYQFKKRGWF
jgi:magnesium transporter